MLIKNRLHISTLFSVVTVFLIGFAIFVASHKINEAHEYEKKASEIVQDVFHLTILSNDYLLYPTKRSQIQRQLKHNSLSKLLSKLESQEPEKKNILKDIKKINEDIGSLFSQLKSRHARPGFIISNKADKQLENRLVNQVLIKSQEMVSYGFQLARKSQKEMFAIQKRNDLLIMILVIALATIIALSSFFIGRSIIKPIDKLREGTEFIGAGNLKCSVGTEAKDEVGQLSRAFDRMVGNLKRSNESLDAEISERKNAQDEIRRSRDYLKNLTDSMGDVVFSVKMPERKIEWANYASFNILGYDPEELIGITTEFLYPNRSEFLAFGDKVTGAIAEGKDIVQITQFLRRKSGEAFPVEITVTIHKEKGETVSVTSIIRDITERKQAEMVLNESRQRFQLVFEGHHAVMLLIDPDSGEIVDANPAAATFYGYSCAELKALNIAAINQLDPEQIADKRQNANTETANYFIFSHRLANGEIRTVEVYSTPIYIQDRRLLFSIIHDITKRKQAERALRESEEKFRALVTNTEEIVYMIHKDGTFLLSEGKGLSKLGLKPGQVVGKSLFEVYKDYPQMLDEMRKVFNGETITNEVNVDGNYFRNWYTPHKNNEGEIIGLLGLSINITEQKQAEQTLQAYQQRLKALASQLTITEEKERRRIAADLHDHVGQSLALARMQIASARKLGSDPRQTAMLDEVSDSLRQTVQQTRDLIYDLSPPQLNEIGLSAAISKWLEEQVEKKYALETECIVSGSEEPMADDVRATLFRNVRELVTNVIKHTRASRVNIRVHQDHDRVNISVRDDGAGFDVNAVSQSLKAEDGFGLFSIKERMGDLGGSLEIISEPGQGTEAILSVPLEKEEGDE